MKLDFTFFPTGLARIAQWPLVCTSHGLFWQWLIIFSCNIITRMFWTHDNGKENNEAGTICFEVKIERKKIENDDK